MINTKIILLNICRHTNTLFTQKYWTNNKINNTITTKKCALLKKCTVYYDEEKKVFADTHNKKIIIQELYIIYSNNPKNGLNIELKIFAFLHFHLLILAPKSLISTIFTYAFNTKNKHNYMIYKQQVANLLTINLKLKILYHFRWIRSNLFFERWRSIGSWWDFSTKLRLDATHKVIHYELICNKS